MCGRTSLAVDPSVLEARFGATAPPALPERYNIAPGEDLLTVRNAAPGTIGTAEWGLIPGWADDPAAGPTPINARSETVAEKPMFQEAFERRRCLVLADGFYEWKGSRGAKQPTGSSARTANHTPTPGCGRRGRHRAAGASGLPARY
jgi:putative SOS response-associated peptidase YedK